MKLSKRALLVPTKLLLSPFSPSTPNSRPHPVCTRYSTFRRSEEHLNNTLADREPIIHLRVAVFSDNCHGLIHNFSLSLPVATDVQFLSRVSSLYPRVRYLRVLQLQDKPVNEGNERHGFQTRKLLGRCANRRAEALWCPARSLHL